MVPTRKLTRSAGETMAIKQTNCFGLKHRTSSIIICAIGMLVILVFFVITFAEPDVIQLIYCFGMDKKQTYIAGGFLCCALLLTNIFLLVAVILDAPCPMMVWIIGNALLWNAHLIMFLAAVVMSVTHSKKVTHSSTVIGIRIFLLLIAQIVWMVFICLVGRHWYVICEEIMNEEYPEHRIPSMRQRLRTWSTWSRRAPSGVSTRMPQVMEKLMKN